MKIYLLLVAGLMVSSLSLAQEKTRAHLKCHLQLADKSDIVHHFVNTEKSTKEFVASLPTLPVFMADGVTEQTIKTVYECVDAQGRFKGDKAIELEKNTAF